MKVVRVLCEILALLCTANACNRYYTTTDDGRFLTRLNRRNGSTKIMGKWLSGIGGEVRRINTLEWDFPEQKMFGLETNEALPLRPQRFVRVNRNKPRGANINNETFGLTGRFDLMGMAIDADGRYIVHSLDGFLHTVDPQTGLLTELCQTNLAGVLDIGYQINKDLIWAVNGSAVFTIDHKSNCFVEEFSQVCAYVAAFCRLHSK